MSKSGKLKTIYNKWFFLSKVYEISKEAYRIIYWLSCISIVMLLLVLWLVKNLSNKNKKIKALYSDMILAVDSGGIILWSVNYRTKIFKCLHDNVRFDMKEKDMDDLLNMISERNRAKIFEVIDDFEKLKKDSSNMTLPIIYNGKRIYAEISMRAIIENGTFKGITGTFKNITNRYVKEIELRDAKAKLEDFKFRIENTIINSNISIIEYNTLNDTIKFINNVFYKDNEEVLVNDLKKHIHPEDVNIFFESLDKMKYGNVSGVVFEIRVKYDHEEMYNIKKISFKPYKKKDNTYTKYIGFSNIINSSSCNNKIKTYVDTMSVKTLFGQDYLANISHEIRTPLNAIVGFSDLICETNDSQERMVFLDSIKTNSDVLLKLITDMLDLSRFESGVFDYTLSDFSANKLCKDVYDSYCNKCNKDVVMSLNILKDDFIINSDRKRIKQVLSNIVENAIRYTDTGNINISLEVDNEYIKFNISDTGSGLSNDNIKQIFDKYGTANNMTKGPELSLSLSKFIIETLGGKIGVNSKIDEGSKFWFYIPINSASTVSNIKNQKDVKINKKIENKLFNDHLI